jgi:hypothetical protein
MVRKSNRSNKFIGLVLIITGLGFGVWGYQMSDSISSRLSQTFSGAPADKVMLVYIAAAAFVVFGLYLLGKK